MSEIMAKRAQDRQIRSQGRQSQFTGLHRRWKRLLLTVDDVRQEAKVGRVRLSCNPLHPAPNSTKQRAAPTPRSRTLHPCPPSAVARLSVMGNLVDSQHAFLLNACRFSGNVKNMETGLEETESTLFTSTRRVGRDIHPSAIQTQKWTRGCNWLRYGLTARHSVLVPWVHWYSSPVAIFIYPAALTIGARIRAVSTYRPISASKYQPFSVCLGLCGHA